MVKKTKPTTKRVNLLIPLEAYDRMLDQVKEGSYKSLTDLIVSRSTTQEPKSQVRADVLEVELRHTKENLDKALNDLEDLKRQYEITYNAMLYHSLPFWAKLGKRLELPNKVK